MRRFIALCLCTLLVLGITARFASADQGVSISLGRIDVNERLVAGGRYHLPTLSVGNVGDQAERYEIAVNYLDDRADGDRPPRDWFSINPSAVDLGPGESTAVQLDIELPPGARPGSYAALIEVQPKAGTVGTRIGAAAATRVSFTVKPSSWIEAWRLAATRTLEDYEPWSYIVPALALGGLLIHGLRRRLRVSINVERRH